MLEVLATDYNFVPVVHAHEKMAQAARGCAQQSPSLRAVIEDIYKIAVDDPDNSNNSDNSDNPDNSNNPDNPDAARRIRFARSAKEMKQSRAQNSKLLSAIRDSFLEWEYSERVFGN